MNPKEIQVYMAPLEGITKYVYRNAQQNVFGGVTKYFAPFIDGRINRPLKSREINDLLPVNNQNIILVPQIMCNNADGFLATSKQLQNHGYQEINLNLGCPSLTVVRKDKGAGFLQHPEKLHQFLHDIYKNPLFHSRSLVLSIKTRLGMCDFNEIYQLLSIYNEFPLSELIIHPRLQSDYYKNKVNLDAFSYVAKHSANPVVYNGDLYSIDNINEFQNTFPTISTVMLGRGLLKNPALARVLHGGMAITSEEFLLLHNQIFDGYQNLLSGETPVLHKMKELWIYWIDLFKDTKKIEKALKKSQNLIDYQHQIDSLIQNHWKGL